MNRRSLLVLLSLGAAAVIAGGLLAHALSPGLALESGTWLPHARPVAAFQLQDQSGRDFDLDNLRGHPTLMFFGFTHCPDVCPTTMAVLAQVQRRAPLPGSQVVFVSIDPQRDSSAALQAYLSAFSPDFIGVRGEPSQLAPLLRSLSAIAMRENLPGGGYTMDHSATLYLLDSHARLAAVFSPPFAVASLTADLAKIGAARQL